MKKIHALFSLAAAAAAITLPLGCGMPELGGMDDSASDVQEAVPGESRNPTQADVQRWIDKQPAVLVVVDLTTNTATKYLRGETRDGDPLFRWNVMTGDVTGRNHGGRGQHTPTGVFQFHWADFCPPYNSADGAHVDGCASNNPFWIYNLRFKGGKSYGMHGTNLPDSRFTEWGVDSRRVSGGCIRNPRAAIKTLIHDVLQAANPAWEAELTALPTRISPTRPLRQWVVSSVDNPSYVIVRGSDAPR